MLASIKSKAKELKKQVVIVYLAYRHNDVRWYVKAFLLLLLVYAMSPIDLIPDFIPILGLLDELLLIPLGVILAMKLIPKPVWNDCKERVESGVTIEKKYKLIGGGLIITIWVAFLLFLGRKIFY